MLSAVNNINTKYNDKNINFKKGAATPSFRGALKNFPKGAAGSSSMNFLKGFSAVSTAGMCLVRNIESLGNFVVDVLFMALPRTLVEASRTPELTLETFRREMSSSVILSGVGIIGLGMSYLLSPGIKKKYGVPFHKIDANNKTIDHFASAFSDSLKTVSSKDKDSLAKTYFRTIFDGIKGDESVSQAKEEIIDTLTKHMKEGKEYTLPADEAKGLFKKLVLYTGETDTIKLLREGEEPVEIGAKSLIKDSYSTGRAFFQDKVLKEFKHSDNLANNKFIKTLQKSNAAQTLLGLAAASALAMAVQPLNSWLTKKKTGKDGFSVEKGKTAQKDNSAKFKALKATVAAGMGAVVMTTLGNFKALPQKLQFNGLFPNVPQLKVVYGLTIIGRLLGARDKNELRESSFRDSLGFLNWLVVGKVVSNLLASKLDKSLIKPESIAGKSGLKKLASMKLQNHNDLIYSSDYVKKAFKNGTDISGLRIKDVLSNLDEPTQKLVKKLNLAQLGGYLYSGIALGVLIPVLNKKITKHIMSKKEAAQKSSSPAQAYSDLIRQESQKRSGRVFQNFV